MEYYVFLQVALRDNTVIPTKLRIMSETSPTCVDSHRWIRMTKRPSTRFEAQQVAYGLGDMMGVLVDA